MNCGYHKFKLEWNSLLYITIGHVGNKAYVCLYTGTIQVYLLCVCVCVGGGLLATAAIFFAAGDKRAINKQQQAILNNIEHHDITKGNQILNDIIDNMSVPPTSEWAV